MPEGLNKTGADDLLAEIRQIDVREDFSKDIHKMRKVRVEKSDQARKEALTLKTRAIDILTDEVAQHKASLRALSATEATGLRNQMEFLEQAQTRAKGTITVLREAKAVADSDLAKALKHFRLLDEFHNNFKLQAIQKQKELAEAEITQEQGANRRKR